MNLTICQAISEAPSFFLGKGCCGARTPRNLRTPAGLKTLSQKIQSECTIVEPQNNASRHIRIGACEQYSVRRIHKCS